MYTTKSGSGNIRYKGLHVPGRGEVRRVRLIAEKALGKLLPPRAVVHHVDYNGLNDSHFNLVICENEAYHKLLHTRTDALRATENPHARRCEICKQWDLPENLAFCKNKQSPNGIGRAFHLACSAEYQRTRKQVRCQYH